MEKGGTGDVDEIQQQAGPEPEENKCRAKHQGCPPLRPLGVLQVGVFTGRHRSPEDGLRRAQHVDRGDKGPEHAGTVHHGNRAVAAPRNTRNSATKPAVPGSPNEDKLARVKKAATAGMAWAKPPMRAMVRVWARS